MKTRKRKHSSTARLIVSCMYLKPLYYNWVHETPEQPETKYYKTSVAFDEDILYRLKKK